MAELTDHADGQYSVGFFGPRGAASNWRPYSPIELYLAGLIPPDGVPDLWVAEDGDWVSRKTATLLGPDDGDPIFRQARSGRIPSTISSRSMAGGLPDASQAQRDFRAAAILLIDESHAARRWVT